MTCKIYATCKLDVTSPEAGSLMEEQGENNEVRMEITCASAAGGGCSMDLTCKMDKTRDMHLTCQFEELNRYETLSHFFYALL